MIKAEHIPASIPVREADNIKKDPIQKVETPQTKREIHAYGQAKGHEHSKNCRIIKTTGKVIVRVDYRKKADKLQ